MLTLFSLHHRGPTQPRWTVLGLQVVEAQSANDYTPYFDTLWFADELVPSCDGKGQNLEIFQRIPAVDASNNHFSSEVIDEPPTAICTARGDENEAGV